MNEPSRKEEPLQLTNYTCPIAALAQHTMAVSHEFNLSRTGTQWWKSGEHCVLPELLSITFGAVLVELVAEGHSLLRVEITE